MFSLSQLKPPYYLTAAAVVYALICAELLVLNVYLAVAVGLLPPLALVLLRPHASSAAALSRRASLAWLLLIVAACPWQVLSVTAYGEVSPASEAGFAKFAVTALACLLAFIVRAPESRRYSWAVIALLLYALIAALGGLDTATPISSLLRTGRFVIVCISVLWLCSRLTTRRLATTFMQFSVLVSVGALAARIGGFPSSYQYGARLAGYLPPLQPNALGVIAVGGLICATALLARRSLTSGWFVLTVCILGPTLILSQSRTSMIGFILSLVVLASLRLSTRSFVIIGLLAAGISVALFIQTNTQSRPLESLLTHNHSTTTTATLGARTSEWSAALRANSTLRTRALGQGLATKSVEVNLRSAQYAPVDGSWPASYLSAGVFGLLFLTVSVLAAVRIAWRRRDELAIMMIAYLIVSSIVTDVFNDISIGLILFLSFVLSVRPREVHEMEPSTPPTQLART